MNKGFTLVEVIAVIVVLCVISLVVFPSFINISKTQEENKKNYELKNIYVAVENYVVDNDNVLNLLKNPGDSQDILVSKLIDGKYLKKNTINPLTNSLFVDTDIIKVTKNPDGTLKYELIVNK